MAIMKNGHPATIGFAGGSLTMEVISLTMPGLEVAEIDTTTMSNATYKTKTSGKLINGLDGSANVAYDPVLYDEIIAQIGDEQLITITTPDPGAVTNATVAFYGFIKSFVPGEFTIDGRPTATITFAAGLDNAGTDTAPDYTAPAAV